MAKNLSNILLVVPAIIGAIALLALLVIWLMMAGMMGTGMGMMNCCQNMSTAAWVLGVLVLAGLVAIVAYFIRRNY